MEVATSIVAQVEVLRGLRRLPVDGRHALAGFYLLSCDEEVRRRAVSVGDTALRSLDAIHIATALAVGDRDLHFVTYDKRQAEAALAAGLKVIQPGRC